jgi:polyisoprenoid-binding protein YceI
MTIMKRIALFFAIPALLSLALFGFKPGSPVKNSPPANPLSAYQAASKWAPDNAHTNVLFSVSHLVVSDVEGKFKTFEGSMENTKPDFSDAKINFSIDVNSINTDNEMRDNHLKSDDFFNAAKFPKIKFESTSLQPLGNNKYKLNGNLTIRDVTRPISFDVTYGGMVTAMGGTHIGFKAKATLNRFDYNLKWDKTTEAGGLIAGKDVDITINIDWKKI